MGVLVGRAQCLGPSPRVGGSGVLRRPSGPSWIPQLSSLSPHLKAGPAPSTMVTLGRGPRGRPWLITSWNTSASGVLCFLQPLFTECRAPAVYKCHSRLLGTRTVYLQGASLEEYSLLKVTVM